MSQSQLANAQVTAQVTLPVAAGQVGRLSQALMAMVLGVFVSLFLRETAPRKLAMGAAVSSQPSS